MDIAQYQFCKKIFSSFLVVSNNRYVFFYSRELVPVVFTASTLFSTGVLFREMQSYGIGAQVAALAMGGTGIFGINYAGIASFLQKRKQDAALWNMASDMETTAAQLAPQEKV